MAEDQVKALGEKVKGKINEGVGKVTNDTLARSEGQRRGSRELSAQGTLRC